MVMKSTTGCSISRTVVERPWSTVIHCDLPSRSVDKPPENIVNVSLCIHNIFSKWRKKKSKINCIIIMGIIIIVEHRHITSSTMEWHSCQVERNKQKKIINNKNINKLDFDGKKEQWNTKLNQMDSHWFENLAVNRFSMEKPPLILCRFISEIIKSMLCDFNYIIFVVDIQCSSISTYISNILIFNRTFSCG